ncbi:hypothetical protein ACFVVP_26045 [Streptomyces sp. NPDC058128]|uniref:hypothetical protein n=1 Tax=Streptomyces sp. NPDC058128 TaxID=3346352 RepID=UPI0036E33B6A
MDMDISLVTTAITVVGTVAVLYLGSVETARRARHAEVRKDAAADRAALESQADELVAAVLALRIAGDTHDHVWAGWAARGRVALRALSHGAVAYGQAGRAGTPAAFAAAGEMARTVYDWDHASGASAAALAAPLARLGNAAAPLLRSEALGPAAANLFEAAVKHSGDDERTAAAMRAFHEALRLTLATPVPVRSRRRFFQRSADRAASWSE